MSLVAENPPPAYGATTPSVRSYLDRETIDGGTTDLVARILGSHDAATALLAECSLADIVRGDVPDGVNARTLAVAIELGRRAIVEAELRREHIEGPQGVAAWARAQLGGLAHEEVWALCLDGRHRLLRAVRLAQGGGSSCSTTAADVLRAVLRAGARAFVLVHNHPSGDPTPSAEDVTMTKAVVKAAEAVRLPLLDHVIIGGSMHRSLFELGHI